MMNVKLTIVIVNWNSKLLLSECVKSILNTEDTNYEIIIVDNNSTDDSLSLVPNNNNLKKIRSNINLGFGAACNLGVRKSSGDLILFLNPDTKVFQNTLSSTLTFFMQRKDIAILGCRQLDENGKTQKSCARHPTLSGYLNDIIGLPRILPRFFKPATIMFDWDHKNSAFVDHVSGGFMMISRKVFEEMNGFDERFFVYLEDLDLAKRVTDTYGRVVFYNHEITIYHKENGTTDQVKDKRLFYSLYSRIQYGFKHFSRLNAIVLLFLTCIIEPFTRILFLLINVNLVGIKATVKGYFFLFKRIIKGE